VFLPPDGTPQRSSVVFFAHGGGWNFGTPAYFLYVGRFLADLGYPAILAGYRLTPRHRFPAQLEDVASGLRAGVEYLAESGVQARRLIVGGHSAGAQLTALLAYDPQATPEYRAKITGFLSMSGPLDFSLCRSGRIRKLLDAYVGKLSDPEIADPIRYANPDAPVSVLCIHGSDDPLVDPENSRALANKVNSGPTRRAQVLEIPGAHHTDVLDVFLEESENANVLRDWLAEVDAS
jgi:acetyl esterase/lipase